MAGGGLLEILKEFGVKLTLDFDKKKGDEAKKHVAELGKQMKELAVHVAEASAAIFGLAAITGENARGLEESSEALGINVERLQELGYAAKVAADVSRGELIGALEGVSNTLDRARHSDVMAAESLVRLGVPMQMITDKAITADQVMLTLADSFKNIHDPIAKARLAQEVFGASGAKLLPLLNKGSQGIAAMGKEARDLGVILDGHAIESGAEFARSYSKVWIILKNIAFLVGNELIKYLKPMVDQFARFIVVNKQLIATGIATVMKSLGEYLKIIGTVVKFVADRFSYLTNVLGGVERVSKYIAIAMGIITGFKIISGLGTLVTSWRAIEMVLAGVSIQTTLIGAGLLALILVVQDLFSDDSIIKQWFKSFTDEYPEVKKMVDLFMKMSDLFGKGFEGKKNDSKSFTEGLGGFQSMNPFSDKFKGMGSLNPFGSAGTATAQGSAASLPARSGTPMTIEVHQTVSVPPGTGAGAASKMVGDGLHEALQPVLRQTRNQALGGVSY